MKSNSVKSNSSIQDSGNISSVNISDLESSNNSNNSLDEDIDISFDIDVDENTSKEKSKTIEIRNMSSDISNDSSNSLASSNSMSGGSKTPNDDIGVNIAGLPVEGRNNIFIQRLRERDPKLFLKNENKNFKSYSKACPWQYKKMPVILTDEEKEYIDKKDEETNSKSYDEHITYSSDENKKKYHYICPRFWCIKDDESKKGRSLTLKQVNDGVCGGWDAVIPKGAKKIPKGKKIFEFTDDRFHKPRGGDNKLVYKPMYPSYQSKDKHPDKLCIPCCFGKPRNFKGNIDDTYITSKKGKKIDVKKIKDGKEKVLTKKQQKSDVALLKDSWKPGKKTDELYNSMWDSKKNKFDDTMLENAIENGDETIKYKREIPVYERIDLFNKCDKEGKRSIENEPLTKQVSQIKIFNPNTFPLKEKKIGYINQALSKFLNYNHLKCMNQKNPENKSVASDIKLDSYCLLRYGIDTDKTSFLSALSIVYDVYKRYNTEIIENISPNSIISENLSVLRKNMLTKIKKSLTLDIFIKLHNGALIDIFYKPLIKKINKNVAAIYKNEKIFNLALNTGETGKDYLRYIISSYMNFLKYLKEEKIMITYEYLWDILCSPKKDGGLLFKDGINLIILKNANDSAVQDRIELICPKNIYSNNIFVSSRPTIILYTKNNVYELLTYQNYKSKKKVSMGIFFNESIIKQYIPELEITIKYIAKMINKKCGSKESIPDRYHYRENHYLHDIIEILDRIGVHDIENQYINYNSQVIGITVLIEIFEKKYPFFIPVRPSRIIDDINIKFVNEYTGLDYELTREIMSNMVKESNGALYLRISGVVKDGEMIVGIITNTNQFIPVNPTLFDNMLLDENVIVINADEENKNEYNIDQEMLMEEKIDSERDIAIQKIKLETKFYNAFRNTLKILMGYSKNKNEKDKLLSMIEKNTDYITQFKEISELLTSFMEPYIEYIDINSKNINKLKRISTCIKNNPDTCKKIEGETNCVFSVGEECKLGIPANNLMNGKNNFNIYFSRLTDELIRFSKVKEYILLYNTYLSLSRIDYNINKDEILLLEEILLEEYLMDIKLKEKNKYAKVKQSYEAIEPGDKMNYDFTFYMSDEFEKIKNKKVFDDTEEKAVDRKIEKVDIEKSLFQRGLKS